MSALTLLVLALSASLAWAETGTVEVLHADLLTGQSTYTMHVRPDSGGRVRVPVDTRLKHGDRVQVTRGKVTPLSTRAAAASVVGTRKVLVIMVGLQDSPAPAWMTIPAVTASMFSEEPRSVASFFRRESDNQMVFTGTVLGPVTLPITGRTTCPSATLASLADQAATQQLGAVEMSTVQHILYLLPPMGCPWGGQSTVGGAPSRSWVLSGAGVTQHELGHALGMWHSHALVCPGASVCATGTTLEYGDTQDTMGGGAWQLKSFNAAQKSDVLGWLTPLTVTTTDTYVIGAYEFPGPYPRALRIPLPNGDAYYVEARRAPVIYDPSVTTGVLVHLQRGQDKNGIFLLEMTPATLDWSRPALPLHGTFTDGTFSLTLVGTTPGSGEVLVQVGTPPPPPPPSGESVTRAFTYVNTGKAQVFFVPLASYVCDRITGGASQLRLWQNGILRKTRAVLNPAPGEAFTITCAVVSGIATAELRVNGILKGTVTY